MEMNDKNYRFVHQSGSGFADAGYSTPGYPTPVEQGHEYPPTQYPAPSYPALTVQTPYGYQFLPGNLQGLPGQSPSGAYGGVPAVPDQPNDPTAGWITAPPMIPGCPPGLEYLSQIDQLLLHQEVKLVDAFTGCVTDSKFEIKNSMGQKVYYATEENDCCTRNCCGGCRCFIMTIADNTGYEVMKLIRPYRCSLCCCPCCLQKLEVQAPPGITIGYVKQEWHLCLPKFTIQNEREENLLKISGPCVACRCCTDINFELTTLDETATIGQVCKQWTGVLKEALTDADNFEVQFPMNLDVKVKAIVLAACFLIDFMFFEQSD